MEIIKMIAMIQRTYTQMKKILLSMVILKKIVIYQMMVVKRIS